MTQNRPMPLARRDDRGTGGGRVGYLLLGGLLGAAAALLFAPKSGRELRSDIADATRVGVDTARDKAGEYYEVGRERATEFYNTAADRAGELANTAREAAARRGGKPTLFTNCATGAGLDAVLALVEREALDGA